MAVNATLLEIPFDPRDLFEAGDENRDFLVWFAAVIKRCTAVRERQNQARR
jgi:hypothetical protein